MARGCHRAGEDLGETCGHVARVDRRRGHAGIMGKGLRIGDGGNILTRRG
jgi:hypothetical protein